MNTHYRIMAGGVARLAASVVGPRIFFDRVSEGHDAPTVEQLAGQVRDEFQKAIDKVKEIAVEALGKAQSGEELSKKLKDEADERLIKMNGLMTQVGELEQKAARRGGGSDEAPKSIGQQFVESERYKQFSSDDFPRTGKADLRIKANITSATTVAPGSAGSAIQPYRDPEFVELPQRRLTMRGLITPGNTNSSAIEYVRESGFTNNAAPVAEGAKKPQSDISYQLVNTSTKVIAHFMKASRQILSDVPRLRSDIDGHLLYGLGLVEEAQILNGDGTGQNLLGIVPQATAFAIPAGLTRPANMTSIDVLRIAMLQVALAEYPATGHVLNPIDWASIELTKDTTGSYIIGNPQGTLAPTLWALPVVSTQAMTAGKFLTGAFKLGASLYDQWESRIEVGYENDDFTKNMVTILGEERLALAVKRPQSFVYGNTAPPAP
ncbi:MAG TPA: phage major capsid protein [Mesorhizobium sp.]|jgi:HK97 family phage major capsid protein|uniref:phage major capsid protein n=1 Tax=Mesorhizobium sp. TaxID=1871066 RepID=UPI002DDD18ED|nr:phage major capsid protein [Mesorhizobium sp.]HEV2502339.1 phage major capsid protein [Mesorhizobium sp.]